MLIHLGRRCLLERRKGCIFGEFESLATIHEGHQHQLYCRTGSICLVSQSAPSAFSLLNLQRQQRLNAAIFVRICLNFWNQVLKLCNIFLPLCVAIN